MGRSFWYRGACSLITGSLLMGLYGCSATENTVAVDTQEQEITQESLKPVTFTFYNADGMEDTWTDPVAQKNYGADRCYVKDGLSCRCQ